MSGLYTFSETPETFVEDWYASWTLFGQVFVSNARGYDSLIVVDPSRVRLVDGEATT